MKRWCIFLLMLALGGSALAQPSWVPLNGPPGGCVFELAINPANDTLYAACYNGGVWRLSLAGTIQNNTWQGAADYVGFQCVEPFSDGATNYVLAGTPKRGLWMSNNGGATLQRIDGDPNEIFGKFCTINSIAAVPTRPDTVYLVRQFDGETASGIYYTHYFSTTRDWQRPTTSNGRGEGFDFVYADLSSSYTGYAYATRIAPNRQGGLYRTTDAGQTWLRINPDSLFDYFPRISGFFQDPQASEDVYLTVGNSNSAYPLWRVYKIHDVRQASVAGMTVTRLDGWGSEDDSFNRDLHGGLIVNSAGDDTIWVAVGDGGGVYRKMGDNPFARMDDQLSNWVPRQQAFIHNNSDPANHKYGEQFLGTWSGGVFYCADARLTPVNWDSLQQGLYPSDCRTLAILDTALTTYILSATWGGGLGFTNDYGAHWFYTGEGTSLNERATYNYWFNALALNPFELTNTVCQSVFLAGGRAVRVQPWVETEETVSHANRGGLLKIGPSGSERIADRIIPTYYSVMSIATAYDAQDTVAYAGTGELAPDYPDIALEGYSTTQRIFKKKNGGTNYDSFIELLPVPWELGAMEIRMDPYATTLDCVYVGLGSRFGSPHPEQYGGLLYGPIGGNWHTLIDPHDANATRCYSVSDLELDPTSAGHSVDTIFVASNSWQGGPLGTFGAGNLLAVWFNKANHRREVEDISPIYDSHRDFSILAIAVRELSNASNNEKEIFIFFDDRYQAQQEYLGAKLYLARAAGTVDGGFIWGSRYQIDLTGGSDEDAYHIAPVELEFDPNVTNRLLFCSLVGVWKMDWTY